MLGRNHVPAHNENRPHNLRLSMLGFFLTTAAMAYTAYDISLGEGSYIHRNVHNFFENPEALTEIRNQESSCVQTPSYVNCVAQPSLFSPCYPDEMFTTDQHALWSQLASKDASFNGSHLHTNLANHHYQAVDNALYIFKQRFSREMLEDRDINGRTPLHLAMEVGAPSSVILNLLTSGNVMMADNKGVTPLMLAVRGEDTALTSAILKLIGKDRIAAALSAQDNEGRKARDWNKMPKEALMARYTQVEVDGAKDEKYCSNSLFAGSKYHYLYFPSFAVSKLALINRIVFHSIGIETGSHYMHGFANMAMVASKDNIRKLIDIATLDSDYAVTARKRLAFLWGQSADKESTIWKYIHQELAPIEARLTGRSLVAAHENRQAENRVVMGDFTAKLREEASAAKSGARMVN